MKFGLEPGRHGLALAQFNHGPFRLLAPRVIQFGRIYAGKPQANFVNDDGVPIDDPAPALYDGLLWERLGQVDPDGARRRLRPERLERFRRRTLGLGAAEQ